MKPVDTKVIVNGSDVAFGEDFGLFGEAAVWSGW